MLALAEAATSKIAKNPANNVQGQISCRFNRRICTGFALPFSNLANHHARTTAPSPFPESILPQDNKNPGISAGASITHNIRSD